MDTNGLLAILVCVVLVLFLGAALKLRSPGCFGVIVLVAIVFFIFALVVIL